VGNQVARIRQSATSFQFQPSSGNLQIGGSLTAGDLITGTAANKATITYTTNTARTLTIPSLGGNRTFAFINQTQTFSNKQTFADDVDVGGNLVVTGTVTANSDIKLKTNIETITNALEKVNQLNGVEYDRIDINDHQIGLIAQEVEKVIPDVVYDNDGTKSVAYQNLVALLVQAIKELNDKVDKIENKN
jgi:hypothetical protein